MTIHYLQGVPIRVPDNSGTSHETRSKWHRDHMGRSTGDVVVTSPLDRPGWEEAHRRRASEVLGTEIIYEVGRSTMDAPLVHSRWAVAEEGGWGD